MASLSRHFCFLIGTVVVSGAVAGPVAHAHGPAPSPLSVVRAAGGEALAIGTSIGLARRTGDSFQYVCPSAWNEGEDAFDRPIPIAASLDDDMVVAGTPDIMRSTAGGCGFVAETGGLAGRGDATIDVAAITPRGEPAFFAALVDDGISGSSVWTADVGASFVESLPATVPLQSLAPASTGIVAAGVDRREEERALTLVTGPRQGPFTVERIPAGSLPEGGTTLSSVRLRLVDDSGIWMVVATTEGFHLWRVTLDAETQAWTVAELVLSDGAIHGPVPLCGATAIAVDRQLQFLDEPTTPCSLSAVEDLEIRCLGNLGDLTFACADFQLLALRDDENVSSDLLFAMTDLVGPDLSCFESDEARDRCTTVWTHFGAEAGLVDPAPEPAPETGEPEPTPPLCRCVVSKTHRPWWPLALATFAALSFRRRRRRRA